MESKGPLKSMERTDQFKPHLMLIYRLPDEERLQLVRPGSHSELGL